MGGLPPGGVGEGLPHCGHRSSRFAVTDSAANAAYKIVFSAKLDVCTAAGSTTVAVNAHPLTLSIRGEANKLILCQRRGG